MPLIEVWQCPRTGKLFPEITAYRAHLRALAVKARNMRTLQQRQAELAYVARLMRLSVRDSDQIATFLQQNYDASIPYLPKAMLDRVRWRRGRGRIKPVYISFDHLNRVERRAYSSAPIGKRPSTSNPQTYEAFCGRITFEVEEGGDSPESEILAFYGIQTGTGGGGRNTYRYEVTLWAEDFPRLTG